MSKLYAVLGWIGIVFGLYALPSALFVGTHVLLFSIGNMIVGVLCLLIARGFARGKPWACWGGVFVSFGVLVVVLTSLMQSIREKESSNVIFFAVVSLYFLVMILITFRSRQAFSTRPE